MTNVTFKVAILGDSRVFDTYYATDDYAGKTYGYDKTFPHRLQRSLASKTGGAHDCVHIPDHFRGRTVQNNILRLALIDPDCIVLCDGIWESLVSKKHVADYYEQIGDPSVFYSDALATELYLANRLALSPRSYADRVGRIASWFVRRRRHLIWLTTPIPPRGFLNGLHFAGNYRPFDGWHECLHAINSASAASIRHFGGTVVDMDALMTDFGGAEAALIDQWHFSASFHARVAEELERIIGDMDGLAENCVSRQVIVQGPPRGTRLGLVGSDEQCLAFKATLGDAQVVAESDVVPDIPLENDLVWVVLEPEASRRDEVVQTLIRMMPTPPVIVFPEELASMDNPAVADRSTFGSLK